MNDDTVETPEDYLGAMDTWHERKLQLVCANPDRQVQFGDRVIYCAGAVAEIYEKNGGDVVWLGKPYQPVYERACAQLNAMLDAPRAYWRLVTGRKPTYPARSRRYRRAVHQRRAGRRRAKSRHGRTNRRRSGSENTRAWPLCAILSVIHIWIEQAMSNASNLYHS